MDVDSDGPYPLMFRRMVVRSTEAALATVDPKAAELQEDVRERSLYALGLALDLPEAWPASRELLLSLSQPLGWQGYLEQCVVLLGRATALAENLADAAALAKLHLQLGWCYWKLGQFDQAHDFALRSYAAARQLSDRVTVVDALNLLAALTAERSDLPGTFQFVNEITELTNDDDPARAHGYSRLGIAAMAQGEWTNAIRWFSESSRLFTLAAHHRSAAQAERSIGTAYSFAGHYDQALTHFQTALDIFAYYPSVLDVAYTQMELGQAHWRHANHEQAVAMYKLCEPVFANIGDMLALLNLYNNYGLAYVGMGRWEEAERCLMRSVELAREVNIPYHLANTLESLGVMYRDKGMPDMAIATWEQALEELASLPKRPTYLYNLLIRRIQETRDMPGESPMDPSGETVPQISR